MKALRISRSCRVVLDKSDGKARDFPVIERQMHIVIKRREWRL